MFDIYCDESRPEVIFGNKRNLSNLNKYMLIGGIWINKNNREHLKREIKKLQAKHNAYGEIKWKNVSPSKFDFYKDLINFFFTNNISFRCVIIDGYQFDSVKYHNADDELGFYKFYYQLIFHWLIPFENYCVFLDHKKNKLPDRLQTLENVLRVSTLSRVNVQAIPSKESLLIQLTDLLMGAVGYKLHKINTSESKLNLICAIEEKLGHSIKGTNRSEHKFNIFHMKLG